MVIHTGGCHCDAVRFEVEASADLEVYECNCSMCRRLGYLHLIVSSSDFRLVHGAEILTSYRFNSEVANHLFCPTCGIKSFYVPRSHPDGFSVNARCLDTGTIRSMKVIPFDGANWESNAPELPPLPRRARPTSTDS